VALICTGTQKPTITGTKETERQRTEPVLIDMAKGTVITPLMHGEPAEIVATITTTDGIMFTVTHEEVLSQGTLSRITGRIEVDVMGIKRNVHTRFVGDCKPAQRRRAVVPQ
jgi:hypothetical protein